MRQMFLLGGLAVVIGLMLGCTQPLQPEEEGGISITIPPCATQMMSVGPKMIPANAEYIRIRIWTYNPDNSKFNRVLTIPLLSEGSTTSLSLPIGPNYMISAISYLISGGENYALTYDSQWSVSILPGIVTPVSLDLQPWSYTIAGPEIVASEGEYRFTVEAELEFGSPFNTGQVTKFVGNMRASLTSFQDPSMPFPSDRNCSFLGLSEWLFPVSDAPALEYSDEATPLYVAFLFSPDIYEWSEPDNLSKITLCIPNRYLGESLHQITVTPPPPPEGSVDLVIQ